MRTAPSLYKNVNSLEFFRMQKIEETVYRRDTTIANSTYRSQHCCIICLLVGLKCVFLSPMQNVDIIFLKKQRNWLSYLPRQISNTKSLLPAHSLTRFWWWNCVSFFGVFSTAIFCAFANYWSFGASFCWLFIISFISLCTALSIVLCLPWWWGWCNVKGPQ